jgi:hypothetical protein
MSRKSEMKRQDRVTEGLVPTMGNLEDGKAEEGVDGRSRFMLSASVFMFEPRWRPSCRSPPIRRR